MDIGKFYEFREWLKPIYNTLHVIWGIISTKCLYTLIYVMVLLVKIHIFLHLNEQIKHGKNIAHEKKKRKVFKNKIHSETFAGLCANGDALGAFPDAGEITYKNSIQPS